MLEQRSGDIEAFEKIIVQVQNDLYRIAKIRLVDDEDVNDAIQNTILKVYKHINKLKQDKYFRTWIIRILINECNNIIKENIKYNKVLKKVYKESYEYEIFIEDSKEIEQLLKGITKEEMLILNLHYKDNYSFKEIAYILKKNINTVKSKFLRTKEKIKRNVTEMEEIYGKE